MTESEARLRLTLARIAHLATTRPDGAPHVIPITFAVTPESVVTPIDHKPKTTRELQRLTNIEANPVASVIVDRYSDDWDALWWVRVDGQAHVVPDHPEARKLLERKYPQYASHPPDGPFIVVSIDRVRSWESTP